MPDPSPRSKSYSTTLVTRGYEMDSTGTIPLATMASYLEHVRWTALRSPDLPLGSSFGRGVIRAQRIQLFGRVGFGTKLDIRLWVSRVGRSSLDISQETTDLDRNKRIALSTATIVRIGDDGRSEALPDSMRDLASDGPLCDVPVLEGDPPEGAWSRTLFVVPSDQDIQGHVNHARYVDFVEDTRWLCARQNGYGGATEAAGRPPRKLSIAYEGQARAGDDVDVLSWALGAEGGFGFEIRRGGELMTRARIEV